MSRPADAPTEGDEWLRPKLSDEQIGSIRRYGTVEDTTVGQVLFSAGDPSYDLIVLLEGDGHYVVTIEDGTRLAGSRSSSRPVSPTDASTYPTSNGSKGSVSPTHPLIRFVISTSANRS